MAPPCRVSRSRRPKRKPSCHLLGNSALARQFQGRRHGGSEVTPRFSAVPPWFNTGCPPCVTLIYARVVDESAGIVAMAFRRQLRRGFPANCARILPACRPRRFWNPSLLWPISTVLVSVNALGIVTAFHPGKSSSGRTAGWGKSPLDRSGRERVRDQLPQAGIL